MNACYKILETKLRSYTHIIFSTCYLNPIDQKEEIEEDLKERGVKGKILFDLLLSHGNNPDRYYEASFDGEKINEESLKVAKSISKTIKSLSMNFYREQKQSFDSSILSTAQKFLIKSGRLL